jgi:hypothetical protein
VYNPLYQVLLPSRLVKHGVALLVEAGQNLFEFIHRIVLDCVPQILEQCFSEMQY